jgi:hypothetical protein
MLPPPMHGLKRAAPVPGANPHSNDFRGAYSQDINAVAEPEPKRKTMVERAGEFPGSKSNLVAPAPARSMVKGLSLKDMVSDNFFVLLLSGQPLKPGDNTNIGQTTLDIIRNLHDMPEGL